MRTGIGVVLLSALVAVAGCDLDLSNPNSPTEPSVLSDGDGIISLAVAMQGQYAGSINTYVRAPALITDEWGTWGSALATDISLEQGEPDESFSSVSGPYTVTYRILRSANNLIEHADGVGLGDGMTRGILALAKLHKAMALGTIIQQYERIPLDASVEGPEPQPREVVLDTTVALLESARADLQGVDEADLSGFRARVLDPGIDLRNTVNAMLARFALIAGEDDLALEAAARVDPTVLSTYSYVGTAVNPIYNYSYELEYIAPLQSFADEAEPGDARVEFWVDPADVDSSVTPSVVMLAEYADRNDPFPLYLPDEMKLIRAEVHARNGELGTARDLINEVRTQCETGIEEPAACLSELDDTDLPTRDDVLEQIAYERRYELYMQGLRWEDLRRLGEYAGEQPKADYLPLPQTECDTNPAAGC